MKVSRNLFETKEIRALKRAEKAEGIGVFMIIVMHLAKLENAIGDEETQSVLSVMCSKSKKYISHIIRDFNLFTIDGDEFQCIMLRKTFKVETTLGEFSDDAEPSADGIEEATGNSFGNATVNDSGMISESSLHYNVRAAAGASPIKDSKIKDISSTGVLRRSTTTTTDFHDVVERIFSNPQWLETVENQMQIRISSDRMTRDFVRQRFLEEIEMNGCYDDGEPFTESRAKRYFVNWVRPGKPPRHELDQKIQTLIPERNRNDNPVSNYSEEYGFGYLIDGRRYSLFGDNVPMDAPPCRDRKQRWNNSLNEWVK